MQIVLKEPLILYETIDDNHDHRADLIGSFSQDISPAIPMPQQWQLDSKSPPGSPCACSTISLIWKVDSPSRLDWISIFDDVAQLIVLDRAFNEEQLTLAITSGSWIEPTMWRLLSICPLQLGNDREHVIEEVCRLGTLLFLAPLWRTLGQNPVWTTAISRKLLIVLTTYMCEWKELKPLLIWTLYFAAIETQNLTERGQLVFMLAVIASGMQAATWDGIMQIIKDVIWCEKVFAGTEDLIRDEVMVIIWQRSSQFVFDSELGAPSGEIVGSND